MKKKEKKERYILSFTLLFYPIMVFVEIEIDRIRTQLV